MSKEVVSEEVPQFTRRIGDHVIHGSNNTTIILGTDRAARGPAGVGSGLGHVKADGGGKSTGTVHIIAGRKNKSGDPDFEADSSFLYLSMKTKVDENLGLDSVEKKSNDVAALVGKSDSVRLVFRKDIKIASQDGKRYIYADDKYIIVKIGKNIIKMDENEATVEVGKSRMVMDADKTVVSVAGSTFTMKPHGTQLDTAVLKVGGAAVNPRKQFFDSFVEYALNHGHVGPTGPTGPGSAAPVSAPLAVALKAAQQLFYQSTYATPNV